MSNYADSTDPASLAHWPKRKRLWLYAPSVVGLAAALILLAWDVYGALSASCLALVAGILLAGGALLILLLHFFIAKMVPLDRFVSDYARSRRFGFVMNAAFVLLGMAGLVLGASLTRTLAPECFGWAFGVAGACICLLSVFTTRSTLRVVGDLEEGALHDIFVTAGFSVVLATMVWMGVCDMALGPYLWARGVAISIFAVGLVAVLAEIVVVLARRRSAANRAEPAPADPEPPEPPAAPATRHKRLIEPAVGQGLCERAVILLLVEWIGFMCWLAFRLAGGTS